MEAQPLLRALAASRIDLLTIVEQRQEDASRIGNKPLDIQYVAIVDAGKRLNMIADQVRVISQQSTADVFDELAGAAERLKNALNFRNGTYEPDLAVIQLVEFSTLEFDLLEATRKEIRV